MTRVQALVSFAAVVNGQVVNVRAGDRLWLPDGADWFVAGLVAPVASEPEPVETTEALPPPGAEHAVTRKRRK